MIRAPRWLACAFRAGLGALLLALAPLRADTPRWAALADPVFQHLGTDQGLPQPIATALAEDGDGFLWVGTQAGLARWDGGRFRVYRPKPGVAGALPDNYILTLHTDPAGRLWIGTSSGGLARYDRATDRFVLYPAGPGGLSHVYVRALADDGAGGLWIATDGGLDHLDPATGTVTHLRHDGHGGPGSLPEDRVLAVLRDRRGALWVGTRQGLARRDPGAEAFTPVPLPLPKAGAAQPPVGALLEDAEGRLWIGTRGAGAFVLAPGRATGQVPVQVKDTEDPRAGLDHERIFALEEARPGEVWLGTYSLGVVAVSAEDLRTWRLGHDAARPTSLPSDTVWALHRDRAGLMWVGTGMGLSRTDPGSQAVLTLFGGTGRPGRIRGHDVISALEAADGRIWLGLGSEGVDILDPKGGLAAALRPDPAHPRAALPQDRVFALAQAPDGAVYLGTQLGLYRADAAGRRVARVDLAGRAPTASVEALLLTPDTWWVGSFADGLTGYTPGFTRRLRHLGAEALTDLRVDALARGADGALWIGTNHGLNRLDPATGRVDRILPDPADASALGAGTITSLLVARDGTLWVGTLGGGLARLEGSGSQGRYRFRRLTTSEGLPNDNLDAALEAPDGRIWASTDEGLAVVDPAAFTAQALDRAEGVAIPAYWGGAGAATREGELLFGGGGGLTVARPDHFRPWTYQPPVVVTDVRVGGQALPPAPFNGSGAPPLRVAPGANSLAVEFAALDYSAPERLRYAYRLDGYDRDWIETDPSRRLAVYTNLPPGRYTLRLRGANRAGAWSGRDLALPVVVLPAWYQMVWFRLLELLVAAALVYLIVHTRTALLRRRQAELEAKVHERTAQLEAATQALEEASLTDPLTGLRNRRFLAQNLEADAALAARRARMNHGNPAPGGDLVFFLADLDHFKQVNDTHGHGAGDAVLIQMRDRLRQVFRDSDILVRWGGEEFLVVARASSRADAPELAERLRAAVAETPFRLEDGTPLPLTCSLGFAAFPFLPSAPEALAWPAVVDLADLALYAAKRGGRNAWVGLAAGPSARPEALTERLKAAPARALADGELALETNLDPTQAAKGLGAAEPPDR